MKKKAKPESKIPTTGTNTNKKKNPDTKQRPIDTSLFKKNEFALILLGALLLTTIIFFLFFRSSEDAPLPSKSLATSSSFTEIEKRIKAIELSIQSQKENLPSESKSANPKNSDLKSDTQFTQLERRVARLEAALSLKFDSLIERMGKLEQNISKVKSTSALNPTSKPVTSKKAATPEKKVVKTPAIKKPAVKKTDLFHTVAKGETLYSISKKYKTSVDSLRKLNNFSKDTKIYPGNNILIR